MAPAPPDRPAVRRHHRDTGPLAAVSLLVLTAFVIAFALFGGCSNTTEPEPLPELNLSYEPDENAVRVTHDEFCDFKIIDRQRTDYEVDWRRNGEPSGIGPRYRFYPESYGTDTLTAHIAYPEQGLTRRWIVDVVIPDPAGSFFPPDSTVHVIETLSTYLRASSNRSRVATYRWLRGGGEVCTDSTYLFEATGADDEIVRCEIDIEGTIIARQWTIDVTPLTELDLPGIEDLCVTRGAHLGEMYVTWKRAGAWHVPITGYRILASYDGPITDDDLGGAFLLASVPDDREVVYYRETFQVEEDERLTSGIDIWITVVAVDERGAASPPAAQTPFLVPLRWYAEGSVCDLDGRPLPDLRIRDAEQRIEAWTDADGRYRIGPFSDLWTVTLEVRPDENASDPGWHDADSSPLNVDELSNFDFRLVPRLGVDADCTEYKGDFVNYLRRMTTTYYERLDRPDYRLYRWESLPLRVYVPDYVSPVGVDFAAAARSAVEIWNYKLDREHLVFTDDPGAAQIVFEFDRMSTHHYGLTQLLEPGGGSFTLGAVIPELVGITIFDAVDSPESAEIISLHELGHALGLLEHAFCADVGYLMYIGPSSPREDWPEHAIHDDEVNAVRTLSLMPQGMDMALYPID